jgi:hypothetical protein
MRTKIANLLRSLAAKIDALAKLHPSEVAHG